MKLTQQQIDTIGEYHTRGYSNRRIAKELHHSRTTVARHLKAYIWYTHINLKRLQIYADVLQRVLKTKSDEIDIEIAALKNDAFYWKCMTLVFATSFAVQVSINLFY